MISQDRAIEIALLYIPTILGDEEELGVTWEDLEEAPKILENMISKDYKRTIE